MIHIFHAFRGWSDVRESCGHWTLGTLAPWGYAAVCFPGVIDLCYDVAMVSQQLENSGS